MAISDVTALNQEFINGAPASHLKGTDVTDPHDAVETGSVTYATGVSPVIANLQGFKTITFTVSGNAADTFQVFLGYHTTNPPTLISGAVPLRDFSDIVTDNEVLTIPAAGGTYQITNLCCYSLLFTKTGTANTPTITYFARKT